MIVLNRVKIDDHCIETRLIENSVNEFEIYDFIVSDKWYDDDSGVTSKDVTNFLNDTQGDVTVRINSRGGEVGSALAIYNRLNTYDKGTVTTVVDGYAWSSAGWIAMAGDERVINTGGLFMLHNPQMTVNIANQRDFDVAQTQWNAHRDSIISIFESSTSKNSEEIGNLMDAETFMSADEAVESGFFTSKGSATAEMPEALNVCYNSVPDKYKTFIPLVNAVDRALQDKSLTMRKRFLAK